MPNFRIDNVTLSKHSTLVAPKLIGGRWVSAYLIIIALLVVAFVWGYYEHQQAIVREHQLQDQFEAQLAAVLISTSFSGYFDHLNLLANDPEVRKLTRSGKARLKQVLVNEQPLVTAITVVSPLMEITYTTPDETSIGADLSGQIHNQIMAQEQRSLVSNPFLAVQGYEAVSVAIPLNSNGKFLGSLAMLLNFEKVAENSLVPVFAGDVKQIYLINSNGVIIRSPFQDQAGQHASAMFGYRDGMEDLLKSIAAGQTGYGVTLGGFYTNPNSSNKKTLISFAPARLTSEDFWSICIVSDQAEILFSAAPSRQPFMIAGLFALLVLLGASHLIRVSTKYKIDLEQAVKLRTMALQNSEEKHRMLIESMSEGVVVTNTLGFIDLVNPAIEKILGQPPHELLGTKLSNYLAEGQIPLFLGQQALLQLGKETTFTIKTTNQQGEARDLLISSKPRLDKSGSYLGATSFIQDFTEKKSAEDLLKMERQIFLGGPVVVFKWAPNDHWPVEYVSPNVTQFGYSVEQWLSSEISMGSFIHKDDAKRIALEVKLASESGAKSLEKEYRIIQGDGRIRWVYDFTSIVYNDDGKITHYLGYIFDTTAVKRASLVQEVLLDISEAHSKASDLESLVQIIRNLLGKLIDTTNFYVALHDSTTGLYSFPFYADVKDTNFKSQPLRFSLTDYVRRTGEPLFSDFEVHEDLIKKGELKPTGPTSPVWLGAPLKSSKGVFGVVAVQHYTNPKNYEPSDLELLAFVSEHIALAIDRQRTDSALTKSEESYRQLVEVAQESIITVNENEIITFTNQAFSSTIGFSKDELLGTSLLDLSDTDSGPSILQGTKNRMLGMTDSYEIRFITKNGEFRDFISTSSPLTNETGVYQGSMAVMVDITERKKTEGLMLHSQKLESLGILAGGIAHDFNNLLVGILGNSGLALNEAKESSNLHTYLVDIERAAQRASDLTQQLMAYSGKGKLTAGPTDLCEIVVEMGRLLGSAIPSTVQLKYNLDRTVPLIQADTVQIRQVIMNLILNATESVSEHGGKVVVNVGKRFADTEYLMNQFISGDFAAGEYAFVEVSDNGAGISKGLLPKVFDPFFTTKPVGRGLGLAAVLGIIKGHQGSIRVFSKVGQGSSFKILLPINLKHEVQVEVEQKNHTQAAGVVLLIDDEPTIRKVGSKILTKAGFDVICAADGVEGLELFKADPKWYDVVVLDLTMPRMGGEEVFGELVSIEQNVKILITSGYSEQDTQNKFPGNNLKGFMQKPFSPINLLDAVKRVISLGPPSA